MSGRPEDRPTVSILRDECRFARFRLEVVRGPDRGKSAVSDGPELGIGSAPDNQLVLTDPTVSRHHCLVQVVPEGLLLRDLGSTNGTCLAGFRVAAAFLKPGAALTVGETALRFERTGDEVVEPLSAEARFGTLLGSSAAMRRLFALLPRIAATNATVLIEGETGTGKTLLAEAIHRAGPRAAAPFVVVDCAAIAPNLIESELFGHEKGAFTGAHAAHVGAFEGASGGTVFLDEIGDLPIELQPKLLRALEDHVVKRLGSTEPLRLDVRVIVATNRDLRDLIEHNRFRSDLYYRLHTVRLVVPPLRERREDIAQLASHFYARFSGCDDASPSRELLDALAWRPWPGNVRELRSAVERAVLFEGESFDDVLATPAQAVEAEVSFRVAKDEAVARWEAEWLGELVARHDGNLTHAARAARMDRNHLRELLRRRKISVREE